MRRWPWRRSRGAIHNRVRRLTLDTTFAGTWHATLDSEIALLAPCRPPTIFDFPIVHTIVCAIADCKNTVIEFGPTRFGEDATMVQLERHLVCLDCDGDRSPCHCLHQRFFIVLSDIPETRNIAARNANRA